jgi:hypothetical protein
MFASEFCTHIISYLGHSISIKYMPSQIAAVSLYLAQKRVLTDEQTCRTSSTKLAIDSINHISKYLDESIRIIGYDASK